MEKTRTTEKRKRGRVGRGVCVERESEKVRENRRGGRRCKRREERGENEGNWTKEIKKVWAIGSSQVCESSVIACRLFCFSIFCFVFAPGMGWAEMPCPCCRCSLLVSLPPFLIVRSVVPSSAPPCLLCNWALENSTATNNSTTRKQQHQQQLLNGPRLGLKHPRCTQRTTAKSKNLLCSPSPSPFLCTFPLSLD